MSSKPFTWILCGYLFSPLCNYVVLIELESDSGGFIYTSNFLTSFTSLPFHSCSHHNGFICLAFFFPPFLSSDLFAYRDAFLNSAPSVASFKRAMQTYARQGGTSAIMIHDNGLQSLSKEDQEKCMNFYSDHNISWIARPPHLNTPDRYKRAGRFKKVLNMNYGLQVRVLLFLLWEMKANRSLKLSLCMKKHILELEVSGTPFNGHILLEDKALELAIEETYQATGWKWKPWAKMQSCFVLGK